MFRSLKKADAASLSFIAGPPTKLKPVSETICDTLDLGLWCERSTKNFETASRLSMSVAIAGTTLNPSVSSALISES
jgi:hypothetical protein